MIEDVGRVNEVMIDACGSRCPPVHFSSLMVTDPDSIASLELVVLASSFFVAKEEEVMVIWIRLASSTVVETCTCVVTSDIADLPIPISHVYINVNIQPLL